LSPIWLSELKDLQFFQHKRTKNQQELNQLKQQFLALVQDHREQEQQLRKEKWKHETTVESLLNRYDNEMGTKQVRQNKFNNLAISALQMLVTNNKRTNSTI
jgi:hypothetical protein